ncbi:MAG: AAA family ATPase [Promethearchaeota archaeon]
MATKIISFSGKGGVGKSTLLVLMLKYIIESKKFENILVIDADPDANIGDLIGEEIHFKQTIGGKMTELKERIQKQMVSLDVPKNQVIEAEFYETLIEMDDFDLIEMGRGEGEGCYCSVNNTLKHVIDIIATNYDIVLIDAPAGLEYFARKTGQDVSDLIIVTDASKMGFHTMERIIEITNEVQLDFKNILILGNRFPDDMQTLLEDRVKNISDKKVRFLGALPYNEEVSKINLTGENLLDLAKENVLYNSAKNLFAEVI